MTIESSPRSLPKSNERSFAQPGDADPVASLRIAVMRLLPSGYPKLERVARELNITRRTLQRRLAEAETSYTELVNEAGMEFAEQLLKDRSRSIASIAVLTGFANHSGFSRAFHRLKGMTPRQFRAQARREVLPAESVDQIGNRVE